MLSEIDLEKLKGKGPVGASTFGGAAQGLH